MKPIIERNGNKVKLNLAIPFLVWFVFFMVLALVFHSFTIAVVALAPVVLWFGLVVLVFFVGVVAMALAYKDGKRIRLTTPRGTRYIQRGVKREGR